LVARAGLEDAHGLLARPGSTRSELAAAVVAVSDLVGLEPLAAR
jgi:hypothetical protein